MNQGSSVKKTFLPPATAPPPRSFAKSVQRRKQSPQNPLQDLNRISDSTDSSDSSSISDVASRGRLRFFLSQSSSSKSPANKPKYLSKTSNPIINVPPLRQPKGKENLAKVNGEEHTEKLASKKVQKIKKNSLHQWQSRKKSGSEVGKKSTSSSVWNDHCNLLPTLPSAFKDSKLQEDRPKRINDKDDECSHLRSCHNEVTSTSLSKRGSESDFDIVSDGGNVKENSNSSPSKTPPIQNSVSPEIPFVSATTPACYGAGYIVSGVTDKRKCRPRGVLIVGEENPNFNYVTADSFDDDNGQEMMGNFNVSTSLLPLPSEASMYWVCSPHNNGDKDVTETSENGSSPQVLGLVESTTLGSISSPSSSRRVSLGIIDSIDLSSAGYCLRRKATSSISPSGLPEFQVFSDSLLSPSYLPIFFSPNSTSTCKIGGSGRGKTSKHNLIEENSPFSLNSLSSGNVIQTPQSDSSSDTHVSMPWVHGSNLKRDNSKLDLDSIDEVVPSASFMSIPFEDSVNSSFPFDCSALPSDSIDICKLPKFLDDQVPWLSSSTVETVSQSNMRISWREGLMSQLDERDDYDCCKCLSDEEDLANDFNNIDLSIPHGPKVSDNVDFDKLGGDVKIAETDDKALRIEGLGKEIFPGLLSCSGAESISTDGTGLVASRDESDWMSCYKNTFLED